MVELNDIIPNWRSASEDAVSLPSSPATFSSYDYLAEEFLYLGRLDYLLAGAQKTPFREIILPEDRVSRSGSPVISKPSSSVERGRATARLYAPRRSPTPPPDPEKEANLRREREERELDAFDKIRNHSYVLCKSFVWDANRLAKSRAAEDNARHISRTEDASPWTEERQQALEFRRAKDDYLPLYLRLLSWLEGDEDYQGEENLRFRLKHIKMLLRAHSFRWEEAFRRWRETVRHLDEEADKRAQQVQDPARHGVDERDSEEQQTGHDTASIQGLPLSTGEGVEGRDSKELEVDEGARSGKGRGRGRPRICLKPAMPATSAVRSGRVAKPTKQATQINNAPASGSLRRSARVAEGKLKKGNSRREFFERWVCNERSTDPEL